jgi:hypothetical protein
MYSQRYGMPRTYELYLRVILVALERIDQHRQVWEIITIQLPILREQVEIILQNLKDSANGEK